MTEGNKTEFVSVKKTDLENLIIECKNLRHEREQFFQDIKDVIGIFQIVPKIVEVIGVENLSNCLPKISALKKTKIVYCLQSGDFEGVKKHIGEEKIKEGLQNFVSLLNQNEQINDIVKSLLNITNRYVPYFGLEAMPAEWFTAENAQKMLNKISE